MEDFEHQSWDPAAGSTEEGQPGSGHHAFALESIGIKVDMLLDLVYYLESAASDADLQPASSNGKRLFSMIYILEEMLKNVAHDLEKTSGDIRACDAIFAVSHVREMRQEISELREKLRSVEDAQGAGG